MTSEVPSSEVPLRRCLFGGETLQLWRRSQTRASFLPEISCIGCVFILFRLVPRSVVSERRAFMAAALLALESWRRYLVPIYPLDDEEEEEEEERACRICYAGDDQRLLVQPCACRGSSKWICTVCLETWRRTGEKETAAYRCGECNDEYRDSLSLELLRERLEAERTDGQATNTTLGTLALELHVQGRYDEAEPLSRELLERHRETLGIRHPATLMSMINHGMLLQQKGDLAAAESLYREVIEGQRETLGNRHSDTLYGMSKLGHLLQVKGDFAAAEQLLLEALEGQRETLGNRHPRTLNSIGDLGSLSEAKGDLAAAELLYRELLEGQRETFGSRHQSTLFSIHNLGVMLLDKGDLWAAMPLLREAQKGLGDALGLQHPATLASTDALALLVQLGEKWARMTTAIDKANDDLDWFNLLLYRDTAGFDSIEW